MRAVKVLEYARQWDKGVTSETAVSEVGWVWMTTLLIGQLMQIYPTWLWFFLYIFCLQFLEKAPEKIVHEVREKAAEAEEKITLTRNRLDFLKSTVLVADWLFTRGAAIEFLLFYTNLQCLFHHINNSIFIRGKISNKSFLILICPVGLFPLILGFPLFITGWAIE